MEYLYGGFDPNTVDKGIELCKKRCWIKAQGNSELYEDYLTLAYVALAKALPSYKEEKAKWSTYLCKCIDNEIHVEYRKVYMKMRKNVTSLDAKMSEDDNGRDVSMLDSLGYEDENMSNILNDELYKYVTNVKLTKTQQKIFSLKMTRPELTQVEASKIMGFSRTYYARQLFKIKAKMKQRLISYSRL